MEITVDEPLNILSQLFIPIILVVITGIIQTAIIILQSLHEKNQYIKLLKIDFPLIKEFLIRVKSYRLLTILLSYMFFSGGGVQGIKVEKILFNVIVSIFDYAIDMNYIKKILDVTKF